ncbi:hypothetical protein K2X30_05045 [bacterium]|nr:hypothetical protein [bacterium]
MASSSLYLRLLSVFALISLGQVLPALAEDLRQPNETAGKDSQDFGRLLQLSDKLSRAVCVEGDALKLPSLDTGLETASSSTLFEYSPVHSVRPISEADALAFLLGNQSTLLAAESLYLLTGGEGESRISYSDAKKRVAMEICSAVVTPGRLQKLVTATPKRFLQVMPTDETRKKSSKKTIGKKSGEISFLLQDVEGRFGKVGSQWWVGGWLESFEVRSIQVGARTYTRLANPLTNRAQLFLLGNADGFPMGYLYTLPESELLELVRNKSAPKLEENDSAKMRRFETFRAMMEIEALRKVKKNPEKSEKIKKLQESYRSLVGQYGSTPKDAKFRSYSKEGSKFLSKLDSKNILDKDFYKMLEYVRVNGSGVWVGVFTPDAVLLGLLSDYRKKLSEI